MDRPVNSGRRRIERDRCARERDCKLSREVRISWELRAAKNNFYELPLSEVWTRCSCLKGPRGREGARGVIMEAGASATCWKLRQNWAKEALIFAIFAF